MLILKQLQTLASNSLAIWQRPEPWLTRAKLSWLYQQQCFRVLQQHVNDCLTDLSALSQQIRSQQIRSQQIIQQHEAEPMAPMIFALQGFAGQTLASAFLLQNDQEVEVAFALIVESISVADNSISVQIQPANGKLGGGGSEPIQISVQLHEHAQPGDYLAVVRIQGFVEQVCHLKIQVQAHNESVTL